MAEADASERRGLPAALAVWPSFVLARVAELSDRLFEGHLRTLGIRARQYAMMAVLADEGPRSQHLLGQELGIDRTSMVALVDNLEQLGLLRREKAPGDRRAYALHLTEDGEAVLAEAGRFVIAVEKEVFAGLSAHERRQLHELLRRLV
ncbi:MAG TPA: MarR family transcriptional regulator [Chloroflexota bacterium]|nr:MarR family transcriptional regulator [Chloroflexota bacterium]